MLELVRRGEFDLQALVRDVAALAAAETELQQHLAGLQARLEDATRSGETATVALHARLDATEKQLTETLGDLTKLIQEQAAARDRMRERLLELTEGTIQAVGTLQAQADTLTTATETQVRAIQDRIQASIAAADALLQEVERRTQALEGELARLVARPEEACSRLEQQMATTLEGYEALSQSLERASARVEEEAQSLLAQAERGIEACLQVLETAPEAAFRPVEQAVAERAAARLRELSAALLAALDGFCQVGDAARQMADDPIAAMARKLKATLDPFIEIRKVHKDAQEHHLI